MQTVILSYVEVYLDSLPKGHREKIEDIIHLLETRSGVLDEPYSRHLKSKIRELRIHFDGIEHRVLFTLLPNRTILLLTAFSKKTRKTPPRLIEKAILLRNEYLKILNSKKK